MLQLIYDQLNWGTFQTVWGHISLDLL